METQDAIKKKRKITRSPSYPSIDLEMAISLAEIIKNKEGGGSHFVPYQSVVGHWRYASRSGAGVFPRSGAGVLRIAALKKFGLIDDKGSGDKREIKLTELALKILCYKDESENAHEYLSAIQEAALKPSIHSELWEKWSGELPSDQTIKVYLVLQREGARFAESSVDNFINQFRATVSFANLTNCDTMLGYNEDKKHPRKDKKMDTYSEPQTAINAPTIHISASGSQLFNIPIIFPSGKTGSMQIPYPLTETEWEQMLAFLKVYKPSLVSKAIPEVVIGETIEENTNND